MNLPAEFEKRTRQILDNEYDDFANALSGISPTSVRVNDKTELCPSDNHVKWCDFGYYLAERPLFTADPLLHGGAYYVQEASSMFLYQAVTQLFPNADRVLDLCAAPGGKSTLLSQALPTDCLLVSNEIVRSRAYILAENLIKWGNPNIVVTNNEPDDFAKVQDYFDAIVVDAPCSGEGMFRKDAGAIDEWSLHNVRTCAARQKDIINSIWDSLREDGILVYSTCTYNREENENNIQWLLDNYKAEVVEIDVHDNLNITKSEYGYRFYPHKTQGEGFYLCAIKKLNWKHKLHKRKTYDKKAITYLKSNAVNFPLLQSENWNYLSDGNSIKAFNRNLTDDFLFLQKTLKCIEVGITVAEIKGKDQIPTAQLALSKHLDKEKIHLADVDYNTAIRFLKKEAIVFDNQPIGYILITYKNVALGWVKNLGNRCNNLYPQNWRIRMNIPMS